MATCVNNDDIFCVVNNCAFRTVVALCNQSRETMTRNVGIQAAHFNSGCLSPVDGHPGCWLLTITNQNQKTTRLHLLQMVGKNDWKEDWTDVACQQSYILSVCYSTQS